MRTVFQEQLASLNRELIEMGALCEEVIALAAQAVSTGDQQIAKKIAPLDRNIDQKERTIEALCLKMLLKQQPVASDLRQISSALKMITDMERIGDQAEDIAELVCFLDRSVPENMATLQKMADAAIHMVTQSVEAYVRTDLAMAHAVLVEDDVVDQCFDEIKNILIGSIAANPSEGEHALDLLMIAKYFERIGDHATNIAEWVIFSVTGAHEEE